MHSKIINIAINKYWGQTAVVLLIIFLVKPLHRVIYLTDYFHNTPVEKYKTDPLLKTNRYKRNVSYSSSVVHEDIHKKKPDKVSVHKAIIETFETALSYSLISDTFFDYNSYFSILSGKRIFILFCNLRL